ncbi:hypothetical protein INT48_001204 [Thamnidium elegans]|uniref:F-box domain-containing protein n=1 Tax=Thamnidium elegans TaxID=101142 RepID=A0A8H7SK88_9FUNG|nr:hypothetical protein INT48_001204 [Thamnidium elegans]
MLFQHVPFEINQKIFEYVSSLDKSSLKNCSTVCKSWYQDTAYIIYHTFTLTGDPNLCISVLSNQVNERRFANHVKVLKAFNDYKYRGINLYDRITQFFPSLRVLDLSNSDCKIIYLKSMENKCQTMHNLRKIKVDPYFDDMYKFWVYFDCVYSLRHTLTYLELFDLDYNIRNSHKSLYFLKDFINLKEIVIRNLKRGVPDESVSLLQVLGLVPGLIRFSIENDFEEGTLSSSKPVYSCLEEATIRVPSFNDRLMKYVLSNFPRALKKFDLSTTNATAEDWIRRNDRGTIESFGTYLSEIEQVEFSIKNCGRNADNRILFSPSILKEYWPFISKALFTGRIPKCHVSISLNPSAYHSRQKWANLSIKKTHNQVYIGYILDINRTLQSINQIQNFIDTVFPFPQETLTLKKQTISSIEILCKPPYVAQSSIPISDSIHILKSAITKYTNLTYFHFDNYGDYGQAYNIKFGTKLQDLEKGYGPYQSVFHDWPSTDSKRSSEQKITYALIESSRLTMLDLNAISIMFDIEHLELLKYKFEQGVERVMDLRCMESLRTLVLDIGFLRYQFQYGVVIRIEFEKDKLVRWYKWYKESGSFIQFKNFSSRFLSGWTSEATKKEESKKFLAIQCFDVYEIDLLLGNCVIGKFIHPLKDIN